MKRFMKNSIAGMISSITIVSSILIFGGGSEVQAAATYGREAYLPVIQEFAQIVNNGFTNYRNRHQHVTTNYFDTDMYFRDMSKFTYSFEDLNKDGIDELLISAIGSGYAGNSNGDVLDFLFALTKNGTPQFIEKRGAGRWGWYLGNDEKTVVKWGSNGVSGQYISYVNLSDAGTIPDDMNLRYLLADEIKIHGDRVELTITPPNGNKTIRFITREEADQIYMSRHQEIETFTGEFYPISDVITPSSRIAPFVERFYNEVLGRASDSNGLSHHRTSLAAKVKTGALTAYDFFFSQEYLNKNSSNSDYIDSLYMTFMNRASDTGGKEYWLNHLQSGRSRLYVFDGFANAPEFGQICRSYGILQGSESFLAPSERNENVTSFVSRFYLTCLGRDADTDGMNHWCERLLSRDFTGKDIALSFYHSREFLNLNTNNDAYLAVLYRTFFDREPDSGGKSYWISQLNGGASRDQVLAGFVNSQEFGILCSSYGIERGTM